MRRATRSLPLLVAAIVITACGGAATNAPAPTSATASPAPASPAPTEVPATAAPTATAEPTATPGAGGATMVADAAGFAMPLAEGWRSLPLDGTAEDILALLPADSQLRGVLEGGLDQLLEAGLAGWAVDGTEEGAVTPNVNLIVRRGIEIPGLDDLVGAIEGELAAVPGVNGIDVEVVDLAIGRAVRAAYLGLGEGAEARAQGIQYTIPAGDDLLILSFTLPANDAAREAAVDEMVTGIVLAP